MFLGIDTGGTYTDAVLYSEEPGVGDVHGVVAKAKARTRHHDLTIGIGEAIRRIVSDAGQISLVSVSTTLATNALVEGVGSRIGLILIGFTADDLSRGGLGDALDDDPIIFAAGGHNSFGTELAPLDLGAIEKAIDESNASSFAVTAQFAVRNPAHEIAVRDLLVSKGLSVTCGHELTAKLNGPKRALTCVLNARLIGVITALCEATQQILDEVGVTAPLMLVRGDGSLVTADFARARPIETILSGPAASLIGARHLTALDDAVVSDIGGTTTDIAVLRNGEPALNPEGAMVGGHRTMVEAIQMYTHGLGGDSQVTVDERPFPAELVLGPRRLVPLSLLATEEPELVHRHLESRAYPPRDTDCRFYTRSPEVLAESLSAREEDLLQAIGDGWTAADKLVSGHLQARALQTLLRKGLVRAAGFTPSDAAHVVGIHDGWDREAAELAANFLAQSSDSRGVAVRPDGESFSQWVVDSLIRRSAELVLDAAFADDGLPASSALPLIHQVLGGHSGSAKVDIGLALPIVALGASASAYYPAVANTLQADVTIPEHADVANAIGAVVGQIRVSRSVTVTQPTKGQFRVHHPAMEHDFGSVERAHDHARDQLVIDATEQATLAGAAEVTTTAVWDEVRAVVDGKDVFVEGTMTMTATGRPRLRGTG